MNHDVVLGVDPGGTTGLCLLRVDPPEVMDFAQVKWSELLDVAHGWVLRSRAIVCERYTITQRTARYSQQPEALMAIGIFYYLAHQAEVPMILQTPADAKTAFPNPYLNELGLRVTGPHARDALRHACLLVRKTYKTSTEL